MYIESDYRKNLLKEVLHGACLETKQILHWMDG